MPPTSIFNTLPELLLATVIWPGETAPPFLRDLAQREVAAQGHTLGGDTYLEAIVVGADKDWVETTADTLGDFWFLFDAEWDGRTVVVAAICSTPNA